MTEDKSQRQLLASTLLDRLGGLISVTRRRDTRRRRRWM